MRKVVQAALVLASGLLAADPVWDGAYPATRITLLPSSAGIPKFSHALAILTPSLKHDSPLNTFEVDLRSGAFILRQTDLFLKDVMPLSLTRTHDPWDSQVYALGKGTNHPYDVGPTGSRLPYTFLDINLEDGNSVHFDRVSKGTGFADAVYGHSTTASEFFGGRIAWNGDGWTMRLRDGSVVLFPEAYYAKSRAQGAATEMRNPQGQRIRLERDTQRNLRRLISPNGRTIELQYEGSRIKVASDDQGRAVGYWYDSAGRISGATDNAKHVSRFTYADDLMTTIRDETGRALLRNTYENRRVSEQMVADGAGTPLTFDHGRLVSKTAIQGF